MTLFFSTVLKEIYKAWLPNRKNKTVAMSASDHTHSKKNVINTIYRIISEITKVKNARGKTIHVKEDDIKDLFDGTQNVDKKIVSIRNHPSLEKEMSQKIEEEIITYLDPDKIDSLINNLRVAVRCDSFFDIHIKEDVAQNASRSNLAYFLMRVIRLSLERENSKPIPNELLAQKEAHLQHASIRGSGNGRGATQEARDISQRIHQKSCEIYSQLTDGYTPDETLLASPSGDITGCCQIIGQGGAGKTTYLITRLKKWLEDYNVDSRNNPIPIYIPLNRYLGKRVHGEEFIKNYIATYYAEVALEHFVWEASKYLLILDGANESPKSEQLGTEIQRLVDLNCRIIITSRYKLEWDCLKSFSLVKLNELDDEIIQKALTAKKLPMVKGRLLETLRRPMLLALYLGIRNVEGVNTQGEILKEHHEYLLSKVAEDIQGREYVKNYRVTLGYIHRLAALTNSMIFNETDIPVGDNTFLPDRQSRDIFLNICVSVGLLKALDTDTHRGGMLYQWGHECYWDYYKAYGIYLALDAGLVPVELQIGLISSEVASFVGDLLGEYQYEVKSSCSSNMSPVEAWLQKHLRHDDISSDYTDQHRQIVTKNLIEIMKLARKNCITACYDGLDLTLTQFYDCALPNSTFDNAIVPESVLIAQGHTKPVSSVAYSRRNNLLVTGGYDRQVLIWDTNTGSVKRKIKTVSRVIGLDISPDEKNLLILLENSNPGILIVPIMGNSTDIPINPLQGGSNRELLKYSFARFMSDSEHIVCASQNGILHVIDIQTGKLATPGLQLEIGGYDAPIVYAISENRQFLVNGTMGGDIEIRRLNNFDNPWTLHQYDWKDDFNVHNIAFTKNGEYCVVKSDNRLIAWNTKRPVEKKVSGEFDPGNLMFQLLPAEDGVFFFDYHSVSLWFWNIPDNSFRKMDHTCNLCGMTLSADSRTLILTDVKGCAYFIVPETFEITHTMWIAYLQSKSDFYHNRHFVGTEKVLFRQTWAGFFEIYNRQMKEFVRLPIQPTPLSDAAAVSFSENWYCVENYLCYIEGALCYVWDLLTGKLIQTVTTGDFRIEAVIPQKDLLVGCNYRNPDYPIYLWKLSTGKPLSTLDAHGTWHCGIPVNTIPMIIHNGNDQRLFSSLSNSHSFSEACFTHATLATFPALGLVVGGTNEGTIQVWELTSQQLVYAEKILPSQITNLTPVGTSGELAIQGKDNTVVIYSITERCILGTWKDNDGILRKITLLKFIRHANSDTNCLITQQNAIFRLYLQQGTLVAFDEDRWDQKSVSANKEWLAIAQTYSTQFSLYSVLDGTVTSFTSQKHRLGPSCAFVPSCDGKLFMISNEAGSVYLLDSVTGEQVYEWEVSSAKDILNCDFKNAILDKGVVGQLITMNGGKI